MYPSAKIIPIGTSELTRVRLLPCTRYKWESRACSFDSKLGSFPCRGELSGRPSSFQNRNESSETNEGGHRKSGVATSLTHVYRNVRNRGSYRGFCSASTSRLTWKEHATEVLAVIRECDFVALDVEYTGLHLKDDRFIGVENCYEAHASGARKFVPCQIGLTAAKYLQDGLWKITPTSVYTLPSAKKFFKVSTSTLQFLRDNNFDFNTWIRHGVEHLTPSEERERKASIERRIAELDQFMTSDSPASAVEPVEFDLSTLTADDRSVAEEILARIKEWIATGSNAPLEIEMDNAFQRLLMHTIIGQQFPHVYSHSTRRGDEKIICIYKSRAELRAGQKEMLELELQRIDEEIGVRLLFDEIIKHDKIIVGHNCFYDLLHVYQTFYGELPDSVEVFKKRWTEKFRSTLDTKYIAEFHDAVVATQYSATLKALFDHMCAMATKYDTKLRFDVQPLPGTSWSFPSAVLPLLSKESFTRASYEPYDTTSVLRCAAEQSHDAGYDSLMTCIVFILQASRILGAKYLNWEKLISADGSSGLKTQLLLEAISSVNNCIRLVKSQPNSINLANGSEGDMARYFFMSGYPNSWKKWDIMKVWSPLWVSVSVIDDTSCWIIVKNDQDIKNINLIYRMMKNPQFTLQTYEQSKTIAAAKASE